MKLTLRNIALSAIVVAAGYYQACAGISSKAKELEIGGSFSFENGQFIGAEFNQNTTYKGSRAWVSKVYGDIYLKAVMNDYVTITLDPQVRLWFDNYPWGIWGNQAFDNVFTQRMDINFKEATGVIRVGDTSNFSLLFATGVMPYKYNVDAKNLGEYLFRSGARPLYLLTSFDDDFAKITGFRIGAKLPSHLTADLFLSMETQNPSFRDWSLSALVNYSVPGFLDAGVGIMFDHLFIVDGDAAKPDFGINSANSYYDASGKKEHYQFGGTKADIHLGIDPKIVFPEVVRDIFGEKDFRIFAEAAVLGFENTTAYKLTTNPTTGAGDPSLPMVIDSGVNIYSNIAQRIPVMFGINVPNLKILDYFTIQGEYLPWPYGYTSTGVGGFGIPFPLPASAQGFTKDAFSADDWKYSVNFSRTFFGCFSVIGQFANDHTHYDIYAPSKIAQNAGQDVFRPHGSYGWWLKLKYCF